MRWKQEKKSGKEKEIWREGDSCLSGSWRLWSFDATWIKRRYKPSPDSILPYRFPFPTPIPRSLFPSVIYGKMTNFPLEFLRSRLVRRLASRDNSPSPQRHRRRHCKTRTKYTDSIHDDPAPTFSYSGQCGPLRRIRQHLVPLDMPFVPIRAGGAWGEPDAAWCPFYLFPWGDWKAFCLPPLRQSPTFVIRLWHVLQMAPTLFM